MGEGPVHKTHRSLARRLAEEGIDYAVTGGMAMLLHGYERLTVDVDLLLSPEGFERFRKSLVGRVYTPVFPGAKKHYRDAETGVSVEIITAGEYPGDGKPKDISFPDPADIAEDKRGIRVARLETLIELKLASGLSAPHRVKDIADVQQMIEVLNLPKEISEQLHASVRPEFLRLWQATDEARRERTGPDRE